MNTINQYIAVTNNDAINIKNTIEWNTKLKGISVQILPLTLRGCTQSKLKKVRFKADFVRMQDYLKARKALNEYLQTFNTYEVH